MKRYIPAENLIPPAEGDPLLIPAGENTPANSIRKAGRKKFISMGLPTPKVEAWKYTDITPLAETRYSLIPEPGPEAVDNKFRKLLPENLSPCSLVFINGRINRELSSIPENNGIHIGFLSDLITSGDPELSEWLSGSEEKQTSAASLNRAWLNDGAVIRVSKNTDPGIPVHLVFLSADTGPAGMTHPFNLVIAEEGSRCTMIEEYTGEAGSSYLTNAVTEIRLEARATVNHYKIQTESSRATHIGTLNVSQKKDTEFSSQIASFGGALCRNNITASMNGTGSSSSIEGLYFIHGNQHMDNHTEVYHNHPGCRSVENFNGVLDDEAHAVFDGKVYVAEGAVQTDSDQSSRSLLLSESAEVDAKPALEIYADDVKCSHSASVGQLDDESLYYLRSRGISREEAMKILTSGFLKEILGRFKDQNVSEKIENILNREIK